MKKVAIVSCDKWINKIDEDLLLAKFLNENGYKATLISWEDSNIDYTQFECLIIRSVWGYQNNYIEFKKWLLFLKENNIKVFNNVDTILNNIFKKKQFEILDKYSIPHIPTTFLDSAEQLRNINFNEDTVIKPIISGSGEFTYKINNNIERNDYISLDDAVNIFKNKNKQMDNGIMIQPYFSGIKDGEYACIYLEKYNTHNMIRYPGVFTVKQKPIYCSQIPSSIKNLAVAVSKIPEFNECLYMRIDIVMQDNVPYIMEVELAEPDLLLKYVPNPIQSDIMNDFCIKLKRRLK